MDSITTVSLGKRIFKVSFPAYKLFADFEQYLIRHVPDADDKSLAECALSDYLDLNLLPGSDVVDYELASDAVRHVSEANSYNYFPNYNYAYGGKKLYRDTEHNVLGGVCAGLANYFNIDPVIIRLLFVLFAFFGPGIIAYIILWIVIPEQPVLYSGRF